MKMLTLEGFNLTFGWHAYLLYDKEKIDAIFKHYYIRGSLFQTWNKYRNYLPAERPTWIMPEEVIHFVAGERRKNPMRYKDLFKKEQGKVILKSGEEL